MISIQIDSPFETEISQPRLTNVVQAVLHHEGIPDDRDLSLVITGDTELQQLNKDFLGIDSPTDVLSFPSDEVDPSTGKLYLGDIIISYPRAVQQAQGEGHPVSAELELLIIHGTLHLLGYDHGESEEKQRMWAVQTEILSATHNPIKTVPE